MDILRRGGALANFGAIWLRNYPWLAAFNAVQALVGAAYDGGVADDWVVRRPR